MFTNPSFEEDSMSKCNRSIYYQGYMEGDEKSRPIRGAASEVAATCRIWDRWFIWLSEEAATRRVMKSQDLLEVAACTSNHTLLHLPLNSTPLLSASFAQSVLQSMPYAGGTGVMPGGNVGVDHALIEQGASAGNVGKQKIVDRKTANPVALLLSSAMMLKHLQFPSFADRLENSVKRVILEGKYRTKYLGGSSTSQEVIDAVISNLDSKLGNPIFILSDLVNPFIVWPAISSKTAYKGVFVFPL
ncbi:isocitrate dehydrogenase [NAD] regulatory subunit 1, mitochondrial [Tanacetum coccineum]